MKLVETLFNKLDLLEAKVTTKRTPRYFMGAPLETGGTSIAGQAAPQIREFLKKGVIKEGMKVLDYGAGKFARNADFLRENGIEVYAYDPYNGSSVDGWEMHSVADKLPRGVKFDVAFTSYVINVVPKHIQDSIVKEAKMYSKEVYHITRNMDVFGTVKNSLNSGGKGNSAKLVIDFFLNEFVDGEKDGEELKAMLKDGAPIPDEAILAFCHFGVQTSKGFQRIPLCERPEQGGMKLLRNTSGFKVYKD